MRAGTCSAQDRAGSQTCRFTHVTRTNLDRFGDRYAQRMLGVRSSVMRDLMAITARPEVISLAGGLPDTGAFDPEELRELTDAIATDSHAAALQYGPTEGLPATRQMICEVMRSEGMHVDPQHVIVTTGGQQGLDLFARTFVDPGDIVIAEGPTYPGVVPVFSSYQADVRQVPLDDDGLNIDALVELLDALELEGRAPKYLYTIPTFHNPGGVSMSLERRIALVELAAERDLIILEDNPYSLLRYEGTPLPTLRQLDPAGNVVYLGTFSKIFAPGVRLGWLEAPPPILAKINLAKQAADLCSSPFAQMLVNRFFTLHDWRAYVARLTDIYQSRRDAMFEALADHMPIGTTWTRPQGGLFVWATLPDAIDTTDLLARALAANVAFVPGAGAFLDGSSGTRSMRLNFSAMDEARITEGIARIAIVAREALELADTLGLRDPEQAQQTRMTGGAT